MTDEREHGETSRQHCQTAIESVGFYVVEHFVRFFCLLSHTL